MKFLTRYWGILLVAALIVTHAVVIGYVRSQVASLSADSSGTVQLGHFRFQPLDQPDWVYQFDLHAVLEPSAEFSGRRQLVQKQFEIHEQVEQTLRQLDPAFLADPGQTQVRERLIAVVLQHLDRPIVQRLLITDWLQLPVQSGVVSGTSLASR